MHLEDVVRGYPRKDNRGNCSHSDGGAVAVEEVVIGGLCHDPKAVGVGNFVKSGVMKQLRSSKII